MNLTPAVAETGGNAASQRDWSGGMKADAFRARRRSGTRWRSGRAVHASLPTPYNRRQRMCDTTPGTEGNHARPPVDNVGERRTGSRLSAHFIAPAKFSHHSRYPCHGLRTLRYDERHDYWHVTRTGPERARPAPGQVMSHRRTPRDGAGSAPDCVWRDGVRPTGVRAGCVGWAVRTDFGDLVVDRPRSAQERPGRGALSTPAQPDVLPPGRRRALRTPGQTA